MKEDRLERRENIFLLEGCKVCKCYGSLRSFTNSSEVTVISDSLQKSGLSNTRIKPIWWFLNLQFAEDLRSFSRDGSFKRLKREKQMRDEVETVNIFLETCFMVAGELKVHLAPPLLSSFSFLGFSLPFIPFSVSLILKRFAIMNWEKQM